MRSECKGGGGGGSSMLSGGLSYFSHTFPLYSFAPLVNSIEIVRRIASDLLQNKKKNLVTLLLLITY